jgi:predicted transcriptional regulator of viral defense system
MDFAELLAIVDDEPVFESGLLLACDGNPNNIRRQLSRWVRAGRIYQLRRGVYSLAPPYQKVKPHPFVVANRMVPASYVSCQSALAHYNLIPEYVPVVISVTTVRPARWTTPLGTYIYRHVRPGLFSGYRQLSFGPAQVAFVARPEKALLDLLYLTPQSDRPAYLSELRLQNLFELHLEELHRLAGLFNRPKMYRAVDVIERLAQEEREEFIQP